MYPSYVAEPGRYVTGSNGFATKGVYPTAITKTGTYTTVGKVITGVGSLFTNEIIKTCYLFSSALNEIQKIRFFSYNNTIAYLYSAFSSDVSVAESVKIVEVAKNVSVSIKNIGSNAATVQGESLPAGATINVMGSYGLTPITYDATVNGGTTLEFLVTKANG